LETLVTTILADAADDDLHITASVPGDVARHYADGFKSYQSWVQNQLADPAWMETPFLVSIETFMKCNAACEFCPYPTSDRHGQVLEEELVYRIIDQIAASSGELPIQFSFCRVNEPFLDKRLPDFMAHVKNSMRAAKINHFSNGTTLTDKIVNSVIDLGNTEYFRISFNDHRPTNYYQTMKLDFERTYKKVRRLHDRRAAGEFDFTVFMGRVGDGTSADLEFIEWSKREFPLFIPSVFPRFDWMGRTFAIPFETPTTRCSQWFQLNFLANGKEAFCCIDDSGRFGTGDIRTQTALEIYNSEPRRRARLARSRKDVSICANCNAWL
jgi:hypothetical protein